jgi:hypothetical protein
METVVAILRYYPSMYMEGVREIVREIQTQKPQKMLCSH